MRILFVHQNFPGQFLHLAPALMARGHDVRALTDASNRRADICPVVRYIFNPVGVDSAATRLGRTYTLHSDRGVVVARAAQQMRQSGYVPDLIVGHSGWGETLFLKNVWPEARLIAYAELYYNGRGMDVGFDPEFGGEGLDADMIAQGRAAHLGQALLHADAAISPTRWQADSHPPALRRMINVIHDGIDTTRVAPDPNASVILPDGTKFAAGDEVLTFVNRNLEPYRGYHTFMRALPAVLAARPNAHVVLVGADGVSYGTTPASGSWKERFLAEVQDRLDMSRVHFTGMLPYNSFRSLMQVSRVHAYLTYPFVLSWSLLEAMSAGALVVASDTGPVREVIETGGNGLLVDFFDVAGWSAALIDALSRPADFAALRSAARATIQSRYDLRNICLPRQIALIESFQAGRLQPLPRGAVAE
ncbi:glycosyltransferase family 4 protein [Falsirhodobacter sp. alg1]|uniref:glycosyltransferase family 4 protein n=1 Tax=Falsirhodobacter sp. alg1 TaxID=1472418 RepID=UPI0005EE3581|nr:glycosyltransferase family 4 protein [Falsirhodobacter sp. alg1]